jgi:hypothetical protein
MAPSTPIQLKFQFENTWEAWITLAEGKEQLDGFEGALRGEATTLSDAGHQAMRDMMRP